MRRPLAVDVVPRPAGGTARCTEPAAAGGMRKTMTHADARARRPVTPQRARANLALRLEAVRQTAYGAAPCPCSPNRPRRTHPNVSSACWRTIGRCRGCTMKWWTRTGRCARIGAASWPGLPSLGRRNSRAASPPPGAICAIPGCSTGCTRTRPGPGGGGRSHPFRWSLRPTSGSSCRPRWPSAPN